MTDLSPVLAMKRGHLLALLDTVKHLDGDIAELGVFRGSTLKAMAEACPGKHCYGFDTFEGMPAASWSDGDGHKPGDFCETDFEAVRAAMPGNVTLVRGVFPQSAAGIDGRFCFAHADFDLEKSMAHAINWLVPKMVRGGVILFDDWAKPAMPGVDRAIAAAGLQVVKVSKHQAYWKKD